MLLSNEQCRTAKARETQYKLTDGEGLYLLVTPKGGKYWRMDYRFSGKRQTAALGKYPEISLKRAREKRFELKQKLAEGIDPAAMRKDQKLLAESASADSFEAVAREWHEKHKEGWTPHYAEQVLSVFKRDFFPDLGSLRMDTISPKILLATLRKIEKRGALDALSDARSYISRIFRYAIATDRAERDPAADLRDAFSKHKKQNHAFLIPPELPAFLRLLNKQAGDGMGVIGLKLVLLTLVRTTELRAALWAEFDLDKAEWNIPAERMKLRRPHIVPLSRQAVALLRQWHKITGGQKYVFPNQQKRKHPCMSENTMLRVISHMGYKEKTTVHGMRSTGSTVLHESGKFDTLVIERQLAHVDENTVRGTYNHAQYLPQRAQMMQWWADYLDEALAKKD